MEMKGTLRIYFSLLGHYLHEIMHVLSHNRYSKINKSK